MSIFPRRTWSHKPQTVHSSRYTHRTSLDSSLEFEHYNLLSDCPQYNGQENVLGFFGLFRARGGGVKVRCLKLRKRLFNLLRAHVPLCAECYDTLRLV